MPQSEPSLSANLRAFLALLRTCEGTAGPDGYRTIVGGSLFDDFSDHPRVLKSGVFNNGTAWSSTAAGAYQFLSTTWDRCKRALGLPDFSPQSQDEAAIWLIQQRGALLDIEQGRLRTALDKCSWEWASLPPSRYGQPIKTYADCERIFLAAGGSLQQAAVVTPSPDLAASPQPDTTVPPALSPEPAMPLPVAAIVALGAELLKLLPMFSSGSKVAERNVQAAQQVGGKLLEIAKEITPLAVNEQQAVEQIKANPQLREQFVAKAAMQWSDIAPALEFDAKERREAREFAVRMTSDGPAWRQVGTGALIAVLSLTIIVGGGALFWTMMESPQLDPGQKGLVLGALLTAFTTTVGFWFGSSASGRQKDATIAEQAKR